MMTPEGVAAPARKPSRDETLIKALVRAHRWRRKIESGQAKSITDVAEQEGVTDAYVCRLLPFTCLAPDIVEAILDGRQPKGLGLRRCWGLGRWGGRSSGRTGAPAIKTTRQGSRSTAVISCGRSRTTAHSVSRAWVVLKRKQTAGEQYSGPAPSDVCTQEDMVARAVGPAGCRSEAAYRGLRMAGPLYGPQRPKRGQMFGLSGILLKNLRMRLGC